MDDDGLVLIQGELVRPEVVQRAAEKNIGFEGRGWRSGLTRYRRCYPHPDLHTPSLKEFLAVWEGRKR